MKTGQMFTGCRPGLTNRIILSLAVLPLAACANQEVTLTNDAGEHRYCYEIHQGGFDRIPAAEQFNKCLNEAGTAGYKRTATK